MRGTPAVYVYKDQPIESTVQVCYGCDHYRKESVMFNIEKLNKMIETIEHLLINLEHKAIVINHDGVDLQSNYKEIIDVQKELIAALKVKLRVVGQFEK